MAAAAVTLLAGFMRGFVGVGSGMLMAPVLAILFGPVQTVGMVIMLDAFVTAQRLPSVRRLVESTTVVRTALLLPVFAAAAWLGSRYFYQSTDCRYRQVELGLLLCAAAYGRLR